jgi:hypothetical protein
VNDDSKIEIRRVSDLLAAQGSQNGKAPEPWNVPDVSGSQAARAGDSVFQTNRVTRVAHRASLPNAPFLDIDTLYDKS